MEDRDEKMIAKSPGRALTMASLITRAFGQRQEDFDAAQAAARVFKFGMFDKGFGIQRYGTSWENGYVCVSRSSGGGDRWEFVQ